MAESKLIIRNCGEVYEPREDSYMLAGCVEKHAFGKVLDLGTGTGIQGMTAALNGCDVTFADIDIKALNCAEANAKLNKIKGKFIRSNLFNKINGKFNTIIFNPPYLPSESIKHKALDGGRNGREYIDKFLKSYKNYVLPDHKVLLMESLLNNYEKDVKGLKAKIIAKEHYFFEDLVVLLFE